MAARLWAKVIGLFWLCEIATARTGELAPTLIMTGTSAEELAHTVPEAATSLRDQHLRRAGRLFGLDGEWHYQLQGGRLNWYGWEATIDVNRASFDRALAAIRALIDGYTKRYGRPQARRDRSAEFSTDPGLINRPLGVAEILSAHWKTRTFNLFVALHAITTTQAGRHYVVAMEVHSPRFRTR